MNKLNYKIINILLIVLIIFFISLNINIYKNIINILIDILFPICLSFFISYSLYPIVNFFNKKFSYKISSFLILTLVIIIFILALYISIPVFYKELLYFSDDIIYILSKLNISFDYISYLKDFLSFDNGISLISLGASFVTKFLFTFVCFIYFLFNMENIKKYFSKFNLFNIIDNELLNYYKGFYLVILIEIIEYLIIYFLIGHPYFLLIAILSGITSVIPFFGALFTNLLALISSLSISFSLFVMTSIIMIIIPIFNSYFVEPKVYNKTLKIPLINIIISCFSFGCLLGFWGIIFAIPLYLILKNLLLFFFSKHSLI